MDDLDRLAAKFYATLYCGDDGDGTPYRELEAEYLDRELLPERMECLRGAVGWFRDLSRPVNLTDALPELYARSWGKPGDGDWDDALEKGRSGEAFDEREWIFAVREVFG